MSYPSRRLPAVFALASALLAVAPAVRAVEQAAAAVVIVVASAGNLGMNPETGAIGYAGTTSPGNAPSAITVGAYDHKASVSRLDDRIAVDSSRGPTWLDASPSPTSSRGGTC